MDPLLQISFLSSFKNRPHMTFDDARAEADQEFELVQDDEGKIEYSTKYSKKNNTS